MMSQRGCYVSNIIALLLPLLLLIFGSVFLHRCEKQPFIPIYLIVAGVFSLMEILFRIFRFLDGWMHGCVADVAMIYYLSRKKNCPTLLAAFVFSCM